MLRLNVSRSRDLRKNLTPHEGKLWRLLRDRRLDRFKFRRQHVIGPYITDFCCPEKKVVIELDGGQHADEGQEDVDGKRDKYLQGRGYRVLRVWNNEIDGNLEGVLDQILDMVCSPSP